LPFKLRHVTGICDLREVILLDRVDEQIVVELHLTKSDEVEASIRRLVSEEVNDDITE